MEKGTERTPLFADVNEAIREAYGTASCAKFMPGTEVVVDYEPKKLSSFRVCCVRRGSIMTNPILFVEQVLLTCIFIGFASLTFYATIMDTSDHTHDAIKVEIPPQPRQMQPYQPPVDHNMDDSMGSVNEIKDFLFLATPHRRGISMTRWITKQEPKMRAFAMIMTFLAAFLMALYTSMSVNRWWTIRTQGIGGIKAATVDLEWTLCQLVTQDEHVLSAIRRYGRASLKLVFLWRRQEEVGALSDSAKEQLFENDLLTEDEVAQLKGLSHCLHETIWSWQVGIVHLLRKEGRIKSDSVYQLLLDHCEQGRTAVQCIHTHLAVRIPMQYVHLLGFVVKMHNVILAVIMGTLCGVTFRQKEVLICCQLFGRTLILPFLFNAILLINSELGDPFDGTGADDFPGANLMSGLEKDCAGFVTASQNMPAWIMERADKGRCKVA
jgi:hypothetical protein